MGILLKFEKTFDEIYRCRKSVENLDNIENPNPSQIASREFAHKELANLERSLDLFILAVEKQLQSRIANIDSEITTLLPAKKQLSLPTKMQGNHWGNLKIK